MELFIKLILIFQGVTLAHWLKQVNQGKVSSFNTSSVFLLMGVIIALIAILPIPQISKVLFITLGGVIFIYALALRRDGFGKIDDDARVWVGWMVIFAIVTGIATLAMDYPNTKGIFEALLLGVAGGSLPWLYPRGMKWLRRNRSNV